MLGADAARPRALDRARLDVPADVDPKKAFRRRAEHHAIGKIQVRREGGGISRAEAAIQGPRWLIERGLESLREVRLKDVAGEDVLAHARHRGEIAAVRERRTQCETRVPPAVFDREGWRRRWPQRERYPRDRYRARRVGVNVVVRLQMLAHLGGARGSPPLACLGRCLRQAGRDEPCARFVVIPGEDPVVHAKHDVGQGEVFVARCRKALERAAPVVCEVARRAALKGWQSRYGFGRMRREQRPNRVERVAVDGVPRSLELVEIDALGPRSLAPYHRHRIGREKRVTTEPWALSCAVEEQAVWKVAEQFTAANRIGHRNKLLDDRSDPMFRHRNRRQGRRVATVVSTARARPSRRRAA